MSMGVYIKGMEMPTEDEEIIIRIDSFGTVMTEYALPIVGVKAVPVPPHGRLIDAGALMKEMHNVILEDGEDRRTFYSVIERQPTIIPASKEG